MVGFNGPRAEGSSIGGSGRGHPARGEPSVIQVSHAFDHDPTSVPRPADSDWFEAWGPSDWTITQYGVFAGGRFSLTDPTHLILGARATGGPTRTPPASSDNSAVIPYAAVTYDFSAWGTVYAGYSRIYEPVYWALEAEPAADRAQGGPQLRGRREGQLPRRPPRRQRRRLPLDQKNVPEEDYRRDGLQRLVLLRALRQGDHATASTSASPARSPPTGTCSPATPTPERGDGGGLRSTPTTRSTRSSSRPPTTSPGEPLDRRRPGPLPERGLRRGLRRPTPLPRRAAGLHPRRPDGVVPHHRGRRRPPQRRQRLRQDLLRRHQLRRTTATPSAPRAPPPSPSAPPSDGRPSARALTFAPHARHRCMPCACVVHNVCI